MLFHIYLFVLFAGIGIGSVEYIRWCGRSLPASADIPPEIALTFDDGPHPVYTKKLLDGLRIGKADGRRWTSDRKPYLVPCGHYKNVG